MRLGGSREATGLAWAEGVNEYASLVNEVKVSKAAAARMPLRSGDAANALVLLNSAAFLACVLAKVDFFAASWWTSGFCVSRKGTWLDSHMLCLYVDSIAAVLIWVAYRRYKGKLQGLEPVENAPAGIFIHGLVHLGEAMRSGSSQDQSVALWHHPPPLADLMTTIAVLFAFFFLLLRSAPNTPNIHAAVQALVYAPILLFFVPPRLGFTFVQARCDRMPKRAPPPLAVPCRGETGACCALRCAVSLTWCPSAAPRSPHPLQTILLWSTALSSLLRAPRDEFYDIAPWIISVPVGFSAWLEASGWCARAPCRHLPRGAC